MSDVFLAVALGLLVVLSAWGTTLAGLKGLGFSAFFGGRLTLLLLGVFSSGFSDDPNSSAIAGYAAPFLLLFVWAPVVGEVVGRAPAPGGIESDMTTVRGSPLRSNAIPLRCNGLSAVPHRVTVRRVRASGA